MGRFFKGLIVVGLVLVAANVAFAAASSQGCESSGNTAAGCGAVATGGSVGDITNSNTADGGDARSTAYGGDGGTGIGVGVGVGIGGDGGRGGSASVESSNENSNRNSAEASASTTSSAANEGNNNSVNVGGDETKVYSYGHAAAPAAMGTDSISVGTLFGGIGFSQTSVYTKTDNLLTRLVQAHEAGLLTDDEFKAQYRSALKRLDKRSRGNDRGLLNLFGLL